MGRVKVLMPSVEIEGDEMAQVMWARVRDDGEQYRAQELPELAPLAGPGRATTRALIAAPTGQGF